MKKVRRIKRCNVVFVEQVEDVVKVFIDIRLCLDQRDIVELLGCDHPRIKHMVEVHNTEAGSKLEGV